MGIAIMDGGDSMLPGSPYIFNGFIPYQRAGNPTLYIYGSNSE